MPTSLCQGDMVRLRSGGPVMQVINPEGAVGEVWCIWTDGRHQQRDAFASAMLEKLEASAGEAAAR